MADVDMIIYTYLYMFSRAIIASNAHRSDLLDPRLSCSYQEAANKSDVLSLSSVESVTIRISIDEETQMISSL